MGGIKKNLSPRLRSATLIETLAAMVILLLAFGIGIMIDTNIIVSCEKHQKLQAGALLHELSIESRTSKQITDTLITKDQIILHRKITAYKSKSFRNLSNIYKMELTARDMNQKILITTKELIYITQ